MGSLVKKISEEAERETVTEKENTEQVKGYKQKEDNVTQASYPHQ